MSRIGERIGEGTGTDAPRYIEHPDTSSGWMGDTRFLDAGSFRILDSNASHLSSESLRHGAWSLGPGSVTVEQTGKWTGSATPANRSYDDIDYEPPPAGVGSLDASRLIAWDYRTAARFGPFSVVQDRALDTGGYGPRAVKVVFQVELGASSYMHLIAAMTTTTAPPDLGAAVIAVASGTPDASAPIDVSGSYGLTLEAPDSLPVGEQWPCRVEGSEGEFFLPTTTVYIWAGWYLSQGTGAVVNVSVFEWR